MTPPNKTAVEIITTPVTLATGRRPRIAFVAAGSPTGELGGAERFFVGLTEALRYAGVKVDLLSIPSDESSFLEIQRSYLRFRDLDLSSYDGVISSKAPSFAVQHSNHVCYLQHTMRVFYDMFEQEFSQPSIALNEQRRFIQMLDTALLRAPNTRRLLAIGQEVANRLKVYNGLTASVINHPTTLEGLQPGRYDYFFLPGRLHRWKRVDLAIRAFRLTDIDARVVIAGSGEDEATCRAAAAGDPRISFTGRVSDAELAELYANALAVLFVPLREDMGLVTFEAFLAKKAVITTTDSGEPANVVRDCESGFVCEPVPENIARRLELLHRDASLCRKLGERGFADVQKVTWQNVAEKLIEALELSNTVAGREY